MANPNLRFKSFTNAWSDRKISDICNEITDFVAAGSFEDLRSNVKYLKDDGYAQLVRTKDLKNNFTSEDPVFISEDAYNYLWRVKLDRDAIVLPNVGNCGESYYISPNMLPRQHNALGPNAILVRTADCDTYFLSLVFKTSAGQEELKKITSPSGQSKFNKTELKNLYLSIPSINEQQKIAEFFTALDEKIRIEEQRLRIFKKQASAVISGIFNRNSDLNEVTGKFNTHHLGSLVEEVKLLNKNKECDLVITNSAEYGIVPQKDFFDRNIAQEVHVDKYTIVENGDFVYKPRISKTAPAGPINRSHLNQGVVSPLYTVFRVNSDLVIGDYLECYFASGRWVAYAKSVANYGARHDRMNITNDDFFNMPIPVPDLKDQANISGLYKTLNLKSKLQESKLSCLIKLKKAFMQRMFV